MFDWTDSDRFYISRFDPVLGFARETPARVHVTVGGPQQCYVLMTARVVIDDGRNMDSRRSKWNTTGGPRDRTIVVESETRLVGKREM